MTSKEKLQIKELKAEIEDDVVKLQYNLVFAYIDTIVNIRKKLYEKLDEDFEFEYKYKNEMHKKGRPTILTIKFYKNDDLSIEDIKAIFATIDEIFKEEGIKEIYEYDDFDYG